MKVVRAKPPIFDAILSAFPEAAGHGVLFCWGGTIFNPSGVVVPFSLHAHEEVHHEQQGDAEEGIREWWRRYIEEPTFRFEQELPAHVAEFQAYRGGRGMPSREGYLNLMASRLSGRLYGGMVAFEQARTLIQESA